VISFGEYHASASSGAADHGRQLDVGQRRQLGLGRLVDRPAGGDEHDVTRHEPDRLQRDPERWSEPRACRASGRQRRDPRSVEREHFSKTALELFDIAIDGRDHLDPEDALAPSLREEAAHRGPASQRS
jgi:hypothetical protein